jgi:hypothetical protein
MTGTCATCEFLREGKVNGATFKRAMECRKNPPQLLLVPTPQGVMLNSYFPPVDPDSGCGQWQLMGTTRA